MLLELSVNSFVPQRSISISSSRITPRRGIKAVIVYLFLRLFFPCIRYTRTGMQQRFNRVCGYVIANITICSILTHDSLTLILRSVVPSCYHFAEAFGTIAAPSSATEVPAFQKNPKVN